MDCKQNVLKKLTSQQYEGLFIWSKNLHFPEVQRLIGAIRMHSQAQKIFVIGCSFSSLQRATLLRSGAHDCLAHDISLNEFSAKIEILLSSTDQHALPLPFTHGDFYFHFENQIASYKNTPIPLNRKELQLLSALLSRANTIVSTETLHDQVWNSDNPPVSNSLEVYMSSLRRKIEKPFGLKLFETVKGVGYRVKKAE